MVWNTMFPQATLLNPLAQLPSRYVFYLKTLNSAPAAVPQHNQIEYQRNAQSLAVDLFIETD